MAEERKLNEGEYTQAMQQIQLLAGIVKDLPLVEMLNRINHAETLGPMLHPTLYIQASGKLDLVKELIESLRPFQREILRQMKLEEEKRNGERPNH